MHDVKDFDDADESRDTDRQFAPYSVTYNESEGNDWASSHEEVIRQS